MCSLQSKTNPVRTSLQQFNIYSPKTEDEHAKLIKPKGIGYPSATCKKRTIYSYRVVRHPSVVDRMYIHIKGLNHSSASLQHLRQSRKMTTSLCLSRLGQEGRLLDVQSAPTSSCHITIINVCVRHFCKNTTWHPIRFIFIHSFNTVPNAHHAGNFLLLSELCSLSTASFLSSYCLILLL